MLSSWDDTDVSKASPEEQTRLLAAVKDATERAAAAQQEANRLVSEASGLRRQAVQDAMDAGIPRDDIAAAAGVQRIRLYQILKG